MIDSNLLKILCCPETRQSLSMANADVVARLNAGISAGSTKNCGGEAVTETAEEYLVTEDGSRAYAVRSGIPVLLADEAILL